MICSTSYCLCDKLIDPRNAYACSNTSGSLAIYVCEETVMRMTRILQFHYSLSSGIRLPPSRFQDIQRNRNLLKYHFMAQEEKTTSILVPVNLPGS